MILILFLAHLHREATTKALEILERHCADWAVGPFIPFALVMVRMIWEMRLGYVVILAAVFWIGNMRLKHALIALAIVGVAFLWFC